MNGLIAKKLRKKAITRREYQRMKRAYKNEQK